MVRVQPKEIVDHLSGDFRRALADAVKATIPDAQFDSAALYRNFKRAIGRKCSTWESVPDRCVDAD